MFNLEDINTTSSEHQIGYIIAFFTAYSECITILIDVANAFSSPVPIIVFFIMCKPRLKLSLGSLARLNTLIV